MSKHYLTITEIAALYSVTLRTARRWAATGMLPAPLVLSPRRYVLLTPYSAMALI